MADKQESWFQAFALNVLLVASICTVGVAGYTIYNLNGTLSGVNKTISSVQEAVNGLTPEARALLQKFNGVLPEVAAVLQDMHRSGVIHKIGDAVGGVGTAVSVLNGDLNGFGVGFFDKILATVEKLKKYADDHPDCESITQEDRDLLENMVTVYLPDVEECLAPPPGMTKNEYIECLGLSGKDFAALSVLAKFDDNSIKNGDDYERLMQVLREYPKGLSSCIICLDGNFWFNLKEFVDRVTKYGINGSVAGTLFHVIPFTVGMNFGAATPPEAVYSGVV